MIALGYGESRVLRIRAKSVEQVSNASGDTPEWFRRGVEAAPAALLP